MTTLYRISSVLINRFEAEYKDYVLKEIFLRKQSVNAVEMSEINDVIIIKDPVKVEQIDEDSNSTSTVHVDGQQLVEEYPAKNEINDEPSDTNKTKVDHTPINEQNSKSIRSEDSSTDCNTNPSNQQLNRSKSNVESSSGMRSTDILDKSCPQGQKSLSIGNHQLSRSKSHEAPTNNLKDILFYCSHCSFNEANPEAYNNLKALLNHWSNKHVKEPVHFSFHIGTHHRCIICPTPNLIFKSFKKAIHHFQDKHPNEPFFVTDQKDNKKCSICEFKSDNLAEHFKLHHPFVKNPFVFDPIRLNKNQLNELTTNKMYKCEKCYEIIVSKQEPNNHNCKKSNEGTKFQNMFEEKPTAIICGECNTETHDEKEFNCHFKSHRFTNDAKLGYSYFKTKHLYANGLIVHNYNLLDKNDQVNEKIKKIIKDLHINLGCSKNITRANDNENILDEELRLQQKELNKLLLFGDFNQSQHEDILRDNFICECNAMFGSYDRVKPSDIKFIQQTSRAITVELHSAELKNEILDQVEPNEYLTPKSNIKIVPKLTKYYQTLSQKARKMITNKKIFRERILNQGLAIQVHHNSDIIHFVNSIEELDKFEAQYASGKRGSRQSIQTPPKRPRNHF